MNEKAFKKLIIDSLDIGLVLENPGGGISEILQVADNAVTYKRGNSNFELKLDDMFAAYKQFSGMKITSNDLKDFLSNVFDSHARPSGHSCNCTFLLMVLGQAGLAGPIQGEGKRGHPYFVEIYKETKK